MGIDEEYLETLKTDMDNKAGYLLFAIVHDQADEPNRRDAFLEASRKYFQTKEAMLVADVWKKNDERNKKAAE